jgi:predicted DNA-binding protein YlxM (UPF0122 family)
MNENKFKSLNKPPACTMAPWYNLIPKAIRDNTMRIIRQETIEAYGYSMDECPKRKVCLTTSCIGRPLPWLSKTAKPYLDQLQTTHTIQNEELVLSSCDTCPIAKTCKSPCHQVNDFLNRGSNKEPDLLFQDNLENHVTYEVTVDSIRPALLNNTEVPWDCLTDARQQVVKKYLYEGKDFLTIAKELDLNNQARVKYEFYSALTRLSEFAVMRKFLDDRGDELTHKQRCVLIMIYKTNLNFTSIAHIEEITKQAVQQILTRVINKYNIKWTIFVKKQKGKIVYNVPGLFK